MNLELTDKVAIVTGSSRGLGHASALALVQEGCRVAICARTGARLAEAAAELVQAAGGASDRVLAVEADVTKTEGVERLVDGTVKAFGGLDILVNNVGLARGSGIAETSDAEWS